MSEHIAEYAINWQVLLTIVFLVGILAAIIVAVVKVGLKLITPVTKLDKTMSELVIVTEGLKEAFKEMRNDNKESHKDIYSKLGDHEKRIGKIENSKTDE